MVWLHKGKVPAALIPSRSAEVISFRCPTLAWASGPSPSIGDSTYGPVCHDTQRMRLLERVIFTSTWYSALSLTWAYKELIGMAF